MSLSSVKSETALRSRLFSSSRSGRRFTCSVFRPPNSWRHREYVTSLTPIWRIASTMFWPCETRTSTCRSFATISSGLYRFLAIAVLLDVKDIPQAGPLQWGWITVVPPEGPFRRRHQDFCIGKCQLAVGGEQAVNVIGVEVGDDDDVHGIAVDASSGEIGVELTDRALALFVQIRPESRIDDDKLGAGIDDDWHIRERHLFFIQVGCGQCRANLLLCGVAHDVERPTACTVRNDGHFIAADLVPIVARHLPSDQRRRAMRWQISHRRQRSHGSGRQHLATGEFGHNFFLPFLMLTFGSIPEGHNHVRTCGVQDLRPAEVRCGSFTTFPPSRRVRFAPRADIRPMPAFMRARPSDGKLLLPAARPQGRGATTCPARWQQRPGCPVLLSLSPPKALHQVKGRGVGLNGKNARPASEPLAPTSGISGAPLPKGGSFLSHGPSRST